MRLFSRAHLTGVILLAYIIGGALMPVAHHHHETCGHAHDVNESLKQDYSHELCLFDHAHFHDFSPQERSIPTMPHDDCAVCRLLYMATTAVEFVSLPVCRALVTDATVQRVTIALWRDIALPTPRGPPAFV